MCFGCTGGAYEAVLGVDVVRNQDLVFEAFVDEFLDELDALRVGRHVDVSELVVRDLHAEQVVLAEGTERCELEQLVHVKVSSWKRHNHKPLEPIGDKSKHESRIGCSRSKCDMTVLERFPPASLSTRMISTGASWSRPGWMMTGQPRSLCTLAAACNTLRSLSENTSQEHIKI